MISDNFAPCQQESTFEASPSANINCECQLKAFKAHINYYSKYFEDILVKIYKPTLKDKIRHSAPLFGYTDREQFSTLGRCTNLAASQLCR